ncbi:MAG: PD40 domain-containing protein [Bacteroidales bacterium]|nr:PD40 domain-containing protein [Bacteroidales bacterium]
MKKPLLLTFALLVVLMNNFAQPTRRAQKQMKHGDYSSAVKILEKDVNKPEYRDAIIPLLAECYRLQDDPASAKKWYSLAITLPNAIPEWTYYYALALRTTGECSKAREMFIKYSEIRPEDPQGPLNIASCDFALNPENAIHPAYEVKSVKNINSDQSDFGPVFYNGELVFASDRNITLYDNNCSWKGRGYFDIMNARPNDPREFNDQMKSAKLLNGKFNKSYHDGPVFFAGSTEAFFTRTYRNKGNNDGQHNHQEIYYSNMSDGKWGPLQPFFLNNSGYSVGYPTLSADGTTIVFVSDMPGGQGGTDLYFCRLENGKWSQPINLGAQINTPGNEVFPSLQADGSLMFSSDGLPGYGSLDIFCSKASQESWTKPTNPGAPLNSSYDDFAMSYAPGNSNGFFTSNRPGRSRKL